MFKPESALWPGLDTPFQLQLFHPGFLLIHWWVNLITASQAKINFTPAVFNYPQSFDEVDVDAVGGYAGFEFTILSTRMNASRSFWFSGASYFRGVGKNRSTDCRPAD